MAKRGVPTISKLKKKADEVFSKWIRNRDKECFTCASKLNLQNGHFVSRSHNPLRYDEMNCNAQCVGCNVFKYGNSAEYAKRLIDKYGLAKFNELVIRGREIKQFTIHELQQIIERYAPLGTSISSVLG